MGCLGGDGWRKSSKRQDLARAAHDAPRDAITEIEELDALPRADAIPLDGRQPLAKVSHAGQEGPPTESARRGTRETIVGDCSAVGRARRFVGKRHPRADALESDEVRHADRIADRAQAGRDVGEGHAGDHQRRRVSGACAGCRLGARRRGPVGGPRGAPRAATAAPSTMSAPVSRWS